MTDPDEKEIIEPVGDYQCPQCGERWFAKSLIRSCFYECGMSFCPNCRQRDSDPVTGEVVDICSTCAEKIQEIADDKRKVIAQAAEIEGLKKLLEKPLNWMEWIKLRNKCECEPNCRCVKCVVTDDIIQIEQALKDAKKQ